MEIYLIEYPENISFGKEKSPEKKKFTKSYLKKILKQYYHLEVTDDDFGKNENGKPCLKDRSLYFNLSHSNTFLVVAIGKRAVGIDIERQKEVDFLALSKRFFHPQEHRLIMSTPEDQQKDLFFRLWTHKEAYIKWKGGSLPADLQSFDVIPAGGDRPSIVHDSAKEQPKPAFREYRWQDYYITVCSLDTGFPDDFLKIE